MRGEIKGSVVRDARISSGVASMPASEAMHCARHMITRGPLAVAKTSAVIPGHAKREPGDDDRIWGPYSSSSNWPALGLPMRMRPSGSSSPSASAENWTVVRPSFIADALPSGPSLSASAASSSTNTR